MTLSGRVQGCHLTENGPRDALQKPPQPSAGKESDASGGAVGAKGALYTGAGHAPAYSPLPGRGGPRNSAGRESYELSERQARALIDATRFAVASGLAFNRMTTVHWEAAGVSEPLAATEVLIRELRASVTKAGGRLAYVWVRESGPAKGEHLHLLWHGPKAVPALRRTRRILEACGASWRAGVLRTRSVGRALGRAETGDADYLANLEEALDYCLKGASQAARERLGIKRCESGGPIRGKRSGVSENIGPTERLRRGFRKR